KKYIFDVSNMEGKKANEKKNLIYELKSIENRSLSFNVTYSQNGKTTKTADIIKKAKESNIELNEEELKKAFQVFEKQSNVDYFINKDAKRFLTEQLDIWIYQYMFSQEVDFDIQRFSQIGDFKKVSSKLINFISQFENELVKIWNKPRFVINSNIVVTIDKLIDKGFDINSLKNHPNFEKQQREWEELGIKQNDGLVANEFLPIDTKYFSELKDEIETLFIQDEFDGILIKSENYQALNSILPRFKGKVDLIYIDPPYNTGGDGFIYMDKFNHASWLSFLENRLSLARNFLNGSGSIFISIDDNEQANLKILCDEIFGEENFVSNIIWEKKYSPSNDSKWLSDNHDFIILYAKNKEFWRPNLLPRTQEMNARYVNLDNDFRGAWKPGGFSVKTYSANYDYPITTPKGNVVYPPSGSCWQTSKENYKKLLQDNRIYFGKDSNSKPQIKQFLSEVKQGLVVKSLWKFDEAGHNQIAKQEIKQLFPNLNDIFETPKPEALLKRILEISTKENHCVMDFFSGSATTFAVALKLNRKFIGIEMGEHFYNVAIPRMKKVLSGFECGISKVVEYKGGGIFKYYELEQYEQILRSTVYKDTPNDYLDSKKSDEIKDCFLFDEKLSNVIICENDSFRVDLSKLYENIDLKESIYNLTGKRPKEITDTKVVFEDSEYELLEILKPLLVW
ncbi:site-specific DNA-methyltransferase, partial [Campylobacter fetus]|nr:site-specific DNA-methyltransferase [Campylobacter fetus]